MKKCKVLSTKKLQPSLVEKAKKADINITENETIRINPIRNKEKWDEISALLEKNIAYAVFTSSNAVSSLKIYLNNYVNHLPVQWKIFCLSGLTRHMLEENSELFGTIEETASNATKLAQLIIRKGVTELLFFCGNRRRDELPSILQAAGIDVHEVIIYETAETPIVVAQEFDAVLFFSPSAVQSFFSVNHLKDGTVCFAVGQTTADSLANFTTNRIITSSEPSQEALLQAVINYFQNTVNRPH